MHDWITRTLETPGFGAMVVPAAMLLGIVASVGSCCNYGILAAVVGYAGSREAMPRRDVWLSSASLVAGSAVAFAVLGWLIGHLGAAAGASVGRYGTIAAGLVIILFGLVALRLVPFRLPSLRLPPARRRPGAAGAILLGLAVGTSSISCSVLCAGPLLPVVLGLAALSGERLWGALITTGFAIGFSVPLAVMMLGVGLGRLSIVAGRAVPVVRMVGGVLMIAAGFWMLQSV